MSERLGISAAQIRKDLSQFGEFGKQGTGYTSNFWWTSYARSSRSIGYGISPLSAREILAARSLVTRFFESRVSRDDDLRYRPWENRHPRRPFVVQDYATMSGAISEASIRVAMVAVPAMSAQRVAEIW